MHQYIALTTELKKMADPKRAEKLQHFFKTGKGEYGEGDVFLGLRVPQVRKLAKYYRELNHGEIKKLMASKYHEFRMVGLFIMLFQFQKGDAQLQKQIVHLYLSLTDRINNWDLVDCSAAYILGEYYLMRSRKPLYTLARSKNLWEKRMSIISTHRFIKEGDIDDAMALCEKHVHHEHDLMHKAVGWTLRIIGDKSTRMLEAFLREHIQTIPRTALRYAIEHMDEEKRQHYLKMK